MMGTSSSIIGAEQASWRACANRTEAVVPSEGSHARQEDGNVDEERGFRKRTVPLEEDRNVAHCCGDAECEGSEAPRPGVQGSHPVLHHQRPPPDEFQVILRP